MVKSRISDHCPCVTSINLLQPKVHTPKFIKIRRLNEDKIEMFKNEILAANMTEKINCNLGTDPNISYAILEETITKAKDKYFPEKTVGFHKHKHKRSKWITCGILKLIQFRDNLYKQWKLINPESLNR